MAEDSPSSLLTQTQRELLDGSADYSPTGSKGRTTRTRLRQRVKVGIRDFEYLADPDRLDKQDLRQLEADDENQSTLEEGLTEMIAFLYRLKPSRIESIIETGLQRAVQRTSSEYEVDQVSISIRKRGRILDRARRKISNQEALTDGEVRAMLQHGEMEPTDLRDYVQDHPPQYGVEDRYRFRGP